MSIPNEIVTLLDTGVSVIVGTRDAALMPECTRAWGIRVHDSRRSVTIFLTEAISQRTLDNIRDNGLIAISCARPIDHVACQLKGRVRAIRRPDAVDDACRLRWKQDFRGELQAIGLPTPVTDAMLTEPVLAIDVEVTDVFHQTPGPGAGERL